MAISLIHLKRLPRPFRARNDIVKIYIAFILVHCSEFIVKKEIAKFPSAARNDILSHNFRTKLKIKDLQSLSSTFLVFVWLFRARLDSQLLSWKQQDQQQQFLLRLLIFPGRLHCKVA